MGIRMLTSKVNRVLKPTDERTASPVGFFYIAFVQINFSPPLSSKNTIMEESFMENISTTLPEPTSEVLAITQEQLQREVDYYRAQQVLGILLQNGLISKSEYNKITQLNRESFSPLLAKIMPSLT